MITLRTFSSRVEAEALKSLLAAHGIDALILADDQGGMYPSFSFLFGVDLKVHDRDLRRAKEILEELEREAKESIDDEG